MHGNVDKRRRHILLVRRYRRVGLPSELVGPGAQREQANVTRPVIRSGNFGHSLGALRFAMAIAVAAGKMSLPVPYVRTARDNGVVKV